jgi:sodium-coupled neutral amino acid transporter 9
VIILPLVSLKSVTFFTKFNSLGKTRQKAAFRRHQRNSHAFFPSGTITVFFLMGVVIYFASTWGINVNTTDVTSPNYVPLVLPTFFCLSGMLSLGMFIHNAIITIMNNNKYQENNASIMIALYWCRSL